MLISNPTIYALRQPGFDLAASYTVLGYTFTTTGSEGQPIVFQGQGRTLSQDMVNQIKKARRDQIILITDIKCQCPDGQRKLQSYITYRIN
jgi:hypothetical protein